MFVNNIPFLIIVYRGIRFITVEHKTNHTDKQLSISLKIIMHIYSRGKMVVQTILMDVEFGKTIDELTDQTMVNNYATKEHIYDI